MNSLADLHAAIHRLNLDGEPVGFGRAKLIAGLLAIGSWFQFSSIQTGTNALVAILSTLCVGYVVNQQRLDQARREKRRLDFEEQMRERAKLEEFNRTSLEAKLAEQNARLAEQSRQLQESIANQELMRKTLHSIDGERQTWAMRERELRDDIEQVNLSFLHSCEQLDRANLKIAEQSQQIGRLTGQIAELNRAEGARSEKVVAAVDAAVEKLTGSQSGD